MVYFFRNNSSYWHGPAKIIGKDGQQFLLKQGGIYIRVHPCRLQIASENAVAEGNESHLQQNSVENSDEGKNNLNQSLDSSSESENSENNDDFPVEDPAPSSPNHDDADDSSENIVINKSNLPKRGSNIKSKLPNTTQWRYGTVIGRGGKASTPSWHYMNIQEADKASCLSLKNAVWSNSLNTRSDPGTDNEALFINLSMDENSKFEIAKSEELQKWKDMHVYKEVQNKGQPYISTRWVLTRKSSNNIIKYKARLVVRGFEEDLPPRTDSPTCSKHFLRLILALIASNNWLIHSIDIKSAFLQGMSIDREIFIKPPTEAKSCNLWLLLQCPYGLADASRNWYLRVKKDLLSFGLVQLKFDNSIFFWYHNGQLQGLIAVHVDDFLYAGTELFEQTVVIKIKECFVIGNEECSTFKYLGMHLQYLGNKIVLSMKSYTCNLKEIDLVNSMVDRDRMLSCSEARCLKQLSGQINWAVTQCRPDIAFQNCIIGNSVAKSSVGDIVFANKAVRKIKSSDLSISFHCDMDLSNCYVVSFCDASFGTLPNGGSQGAFITLLVGQNGVYSPIAWQSRRVRRVVKSTIAAECLAAIEAAENAILLTFALREILKKLL